MTPRTPLLLAVFPVLVVGCVEYEVVDPDPPLPGMHNPRDLEGQWEEEVYPQTSSQKVDILWVLDSSISMYEENATLAELFPLFIAPFEELEADFHIGVTTTDMGYFGGPEAGTAGRLKRVGGEAWIDNQTEDPVGLFAQLTDVYAPFSESAGVEKGREAAWTALELLRTRDNLGFLRNEADAWLHITVVSDENDSSTRDPIGKREFINWIHTIRPQGFRTTFNSIVTVNPQNPNESRGDDYIALTEAIGGEVFDLHDNDWDEILETLGGLQAPGMAEEWFLNHLPIVDTLEVYVQQGDVTFAFERDSDWVYDPVRNSVRFVEFQPPEASTVILRYERAWTDLGLD